MSWLYDDQDLVQPPLPTSTTTHSNTRPAHDFELFHEQVAPIDVDQTDLQPVAADQGIKYVRVRNLQWWTNENTLRDILSECGVIKSIEFEASMKNGKSLGIANIEFETSDAALRAIDLIDNHDVDGKPVNASLLVVEDVKVHNVSQSQRQHQPQNNQQARKQISHKHPVKSPSRTVTSVQEPPPDIPRQQKIPSRETSMGRTGKSGDNRQDVSDRAGMRDINRGQYGRSHSYSSQDHKDRDHTRPVSSSRHEHQSHRRESHTRRDKDRVHPAETARTSRSGSNRDSSEIDPHHAKDAECSRRSSYPDDRYSAHSRRAESDRGSRDSRPDYDGSHLRSHRSYEDDRASKRTLEYSKDHGSGYDRHRDRHHDRTELHDRIRHLHHNDADNRHKKKRR